MPVHTFLVQPFHIGVAGAVQVMPGREIVTEIRIAVIHAWLVIVPGRGDMQFPDEPAIISGVGKAFCDQRCRCSGRLHAPLILALIEDG